MKLLSLSLSLSLALLILASFQSIAATKATAPTLTCRTDTAANFVNTCAPDVVFRVTMQDGMNLDDMGLSNLLALSLFDTGAINIVKIVHTTVSPSNSTW